MESMSHESWELKLLPFKDETTMILIFHLLLSETNMHHSSIPNNIQFRINFPFFWKEDFVNNFDTVRDHLPIQCCPVPPSALEQP